jgi:hypothetical protein
MFRKAERARKFLKLILTFIPANFLEMVGNEENAECDPSQASGFSALFSFRAKSEGAAVYRGLVTHIHP